MKRIRKAEKDNSKFDLQVTKDLNTNKTILENSFYSPRNKDITFREIYIKELETDGLIVYINGTVDSQLIEQFVIKPLQHFTTDNPKKEDKIKLLLTDILTGTTGERINAFSLITKKALKGNVIILVEGCSEALAVETPGFESRSIPEPKNEVVVKGPREAFVEAKSKNLTLIRKQLKDRGLISEEIVVGEREENEISLLYLESIADPDLVKQVREKVASIKTDAVQQLSILEQYIEERPYSLVPSCLLTERPDRTAAFLREGHVAIFNEHSPYALITPITFWSLFHTAEDYYERWAYGNFIRIIRLISFMIALLTPALYIAATNYHAEMIPTDLLLAIGATRETVPFPVVIEVLIMELTFEILREAGIRIPSVIGPTIGIVGALILGQAAVEANVISPIMVLVVAITGLASFAIPEISFSFIIRIFRFIFFFTASILGFYGISLLAVMCLAYLASVKTFGVAFLSPFAPYFPSSKDLITRPPVWKMWLRPLNLHPQRKERKQKPERE